MFWIHSFSITQVTRNQKIRNIYWVMTDINLVGFFPKFSHIMKISIILDPCNDFPAFLGNARISFFYGHIQIICFFYLNIFKETLYHQNFNHSWSHFPNVASQSYSRMLYQMNLNTVSFLCFFIFSPYYEYPGPLWKNLSLVYLSSIRWFTTYVFGLSALSYTFFCKI